MNFDNLYKAGKAFLLFSVGIFVLSLSINLWRDGHNKCHSFKWNKKNHSSCSKAKDVDVEVLAFDTDDVKIEDLDKLFNDEELKAILEKHAGESIKFEDESVDTLEDGTVMIKKFKTVIVGE